MEEVRILHLGVFAGDQLAGSVTLNSVDRALLERIAWRAEVGNDASRRVVEQAGFTVEGLLRQALRAQPGRRDHWVGSLLKDAVR